MDYWCALWFWPITQSSALPSREQWWLEIGAILEGNIVDLAPQNQFDFTPAPVAQQLLPEVQTTLFGAVQPMLATAQTQPNLHDKFGQLRISRLRQHFPRVKTVEAIARQAPLHALGTEFCRCLCQARRFRSGAGESALA